MKKQNPLLLLTALVLLPGAIGSATADDLQSLCNSLQQEAVSTPPVSRPPKKSNPPTKKRPQPISQTPAQPQNVILSPKDKFPQQVAGMYVAGNFMPKFLEDDGLVLVAAEDFMNPFARQFIVSNVRTGVAPGQVVPVSSPHLIQVSPTKPLVIVSRGIVPGTYIVNSQ